MKQQTKRKPAWGRILITLVLLTFLCYGVHRVFTIVRAYNSGVEVEEPSLEAYPVRGVDVSRYQGTIDWQVLASQNLSFAFIKATEGSSHQDPCFEANWYGAQGTELYIGAYHFFSYESSGETQAQNFIETVGRADNMLPPVVDLEFYGKYYDEPLSKSETRTILRDLLDALEDYYEVKPIIYTTPRAYYSYILGGGFGDYPMWIRDVHVEPFVRWSFWQYSDQGWMEGYDGVQSDQLEANIDLNVYNGSLEQMQQEFGLPAKEESSE